MAYHRGKQKQLVLLQLITVIFPGRTAFISPLPGPLSLFMELNDYFPDEKIMRQLCKERIKTAKSADDQQDICRFMGNQQVGGTRPFINTILPPRKKWAAYRPPNRTRVPDADLASLIYATLHLLQSQPEVPWAVNLRRYVERIRQRVFSDGPFSFGRPQITWENKEGCKYRPIARFSLEDNVINSLFAGYLRDLCDSGFESSSFAFRSRTDEGVMPTHHGAFEAIYELKTTASADLWVAECDIRGFYDTVDHQVALQAFQRVLQQVGNLRPERQLHPRALEIFGAYLACYSFPQSVLQEALPGLRRKQRNAQVPWPEESLARYHAHPRTQSIGVPQGGALSCIIANLVLDRADKAVRAVRERLGADIHYFRYCDDMIVFARQESHCREAFEAYLRALEALKLPYHNPVKVDVYNKSFWNRKSKHPYCWTGRKGPGCVPWVQFVGYQIRYDGLVRIKGKSVKKQLRKIRNTIDHVKFGIKHELGSTGSSRILASKDQVLLSVMWRLIYSAVGKVNPTEGQRGPRPMCWAGGYKALNRKPVVPAFLKRLDWFREKQMARMHQAAIPYGPGIPLKNKGSSMKVQSG